MSKCSMCSSKVNFKLCLFRWGSGGVQIDSCSVWHQRANVSLHPNADCSSVEGFNSAVWFLLTSNGLFYNSAHLWTKCVTKSDGKDSVFLVELIKCDRRLDLQSTLPLHAIFIRLYMSHSDICHVVIEDNLPLYFRDTLPPPASSCHTYA